MRIRKIAVALLGLLMAGTCAAQINSSLPYRTLDPVKAPVSGVLGDTRKDRIEVIQFFYFGCPHCFDQQPLIDDWLAKIPADVEFRYLPALRDDKSITLTRAYFALAALGEEKRLRRSIYEVIKFDGVMLGDEKVLFDRVAQRRRSRAIRRSLQLGRHRGTPCASAENDCRLQYSRHPDPCGRRKVPFFERRSWQSSRSHPIARPVG